MHTLLSWLKWLLLYPFILLLVGFSLALAATNLLTSPSNNRDWSTDQAVLPYAQIDGDNVLIRNIRNFTYASTTSYSANYYDKEFDLGALKGVWYIVEPFSGFVGSAHTFLSFEFENDQFVAISVEIRKEKGEKFSALKGLFNRYEIMYVIADEKDAVKLRSNYRKDKVYAYPVNTTKEKVRALFLDMLSRANSLKDKPEFYNSLTNNCTTNIMAHVNTITPKKVPLSYKVLLPSYSDELAYDLGLLNTNLPFEDARNKYLINDRALKYADDPNFSRKIRE